MYNLKLERVTENRQQSFENITAQLNHYMTGADDLVTTMFASYQQPLSYEFEVDWTSKVTQFADYYHRQIVEGSGELVGQGQFAANEQAVTQWQHVTALGPSFNTALSLLQSLHAVAYVSPHNFAYIKQRKVKQGAFLSAVLNGQFQPRLTDDKLTSSHIVRINEQLFFAMGRKQTANSDDYIILIYDLARVSMWLNSIAPEAGEYVFLNQAEQVLASSKKAVKQVTNINEYWPAAATDTIFDNNSNYFSSSPSDSPVYARYFESYHAFVAPIRYEIFLEFTFLVLFLSMMFSAFFWFSQRIFVKPMTHLMAYLEHHEHRSDTLQSYAVPKDWQPWFRRVKRVFARNEELVNSLQEANRELDGQVQLKSKQLSRSIDAKERHLALINTILNNVPDLIYFKNIDGSFLGCNKAYENYLGVTQAQLVGQQLSDISNDADHLIELEQRVLVERTVIEQRIESDHKTYHLSIAPFYNEQQQLLGTMGIGRDITEQQHALIALKDSESKFRSAIEYAANGVILLSLNHDVLQLNRAARKIFAVDNSANKQLNLTLTALFSEQPRQELQALLEQLLNEKKKVCHLSLAQEQQGCWLQLSVSLVWDTHQAPYYYVIHVQDVSALIQAKNDAERATLAKSRFMANLSHEIRTPLNAVLGLIDVVALKGLTAEQRKLAEQAKGAAQSLLGLLNRMLDFARVESEQAQLTLKPFNLQELLTICDSIVKPMCDDKGLQLSIKKAAAIENNLIGDQICLQQVLTNLLTNAVKFTEHGHVTLTLELISDTAQQQVIRFIVADTGIGIDPADQSRLFDAFTQGDESLTRTYQGVGLGLAIVKHEVALMGGEIKLISDKGIGSEFSFSLTLAKAKNGLIPSATQSLANYDSVSGLLVMVIDDNPLNLDIISSILEQQEMTVVCTNNAINGVDLAVNLRPDLVLMDIQMPVMDGCQASLLLREQFDQVTLPIFALTAHSEVADIQQSLAAGMNKHLTKPVVASKLLAAISETIKPKAVFFDRKFVLSQFANNQALLWTMLAKFADLLSLKQQQLHSCNNADELKTLVHTLKGSAGNLGFQRLSSCAQQCETALKQQHKLPRPLNDELMLQLKQVIAFILAQEATQK
ncbi:ATP-binding protein [Pseudoalteromonas mariniglutinosa]|uniref:PAS domain-containing hybrid sensor histidine kinase/response regulator n=1 Tax=Pseudoalteromonas mariniglutinosa TaxID=206042 RepID=UPI00384DBDFF